MTESIDRREFVRRVPLAATALGAPAWVARAFPGPRPQDPEPHAKAASERALQLQAALRRATARGKPLIVLVVPADPTLAWQRGQLVGPFVNRGGRDVLFDLALGELACATVAEVEAAVGPLGVEGAPLLLVVEPPRDSTPARATAVVEKVSGLTDEIRSSQEPDPDEFPGQPHERTEQLRRIHAAWGRRLRTALGHGQPGLASRADQVRMRLGDSEQESIDAFVAGGAKPDGALLLQCAAIVRLAAARAARLADRQRLLGALEHEAREAILHSRIPGSKWARTQGCGTTIEGERGGIGIACGMAMVPEISQRFLVFLHGH